ncbi:molecular chaperone DnaJ [Salmonella enterica]|uniref:molecular chaperone DnaJ n=1 Tax=Salmonella enterica TaxID=28901 RepID=UPI000D56638F|nr:molecular chaperone DnaJ [Salmonella enterica]EAA9026836.1 molecular chaperone DnaJ [Salmonella enterica subsp. enterica serovar Oranienburg]EAB6504946.1 molecular chaperone DnaJ [Salmonella enterica subsp. enterica serovar Richmond]EBH8249357.1 molecular chaperone DnaJ [Salmonella enterica subsp. enterica serovar Bareilly str. CFSAN000189]EBR8637955.1 molecular chaperone DnaJ [Salmonella enterica subsp. enterica serovar Bareilly]ECD5302497.1 molecular chaperone DnaJ [Salmonella enterica su
MTTITKEWLQQTIAEFENTRDDIPFGLSDDDAKILIVLKRALVSLDAEPVAYIFKHPAGELFWSLTDESNKGQNDVMPVYAAQPVQETGVYKDMLNIIGLLEKNEWAEHCTSTVLGSLLESEITRLVSKEQPTPIVPESISVRQAISALESADSVTTIGQAYKMGWNACRAAMLQGVEQPQNARQNIPENIPDGNSPAIPDDWVMVPKKLTAENGAKSLLSGEFLETTFISCPECFADEECESCDGSGRIKIEVPVSWTTIKAIWNKGVEHFRSSTATGDN